MNLKEHFVKFHSIIDMKIKMFEEEKIKIYKNVQ